MRGFIIGLVVIIVAVVAALGFGLVDIDQTREARLPEVAVEGGQAPAFDVKAADVDVGTRKTDIDVPVVGTRKTEIDVPVVGTKETDVDVPVVDVKKPH